MSLVDITEILRDAQDDTRNYQTERKSGRIQNQSLYEGGAGTALQPPLAGCHGLAEPVPVDETEHVHDGRTACVGV